MAQRHISLSDGKTKDFITKLLGELASVKDELNQIEGVLIKQEDFYIDNKEALALERSEKESMHENLVKEQGEHAILKKKFEELKKKYVALDENMLILKFNIVFSMIVVQR